MLLFLLLEVGGALVPLQACVTHAHVLPFWHVLQQQDPCSSCSLAGLTRPTLVLNAPHPPLLAHPPAPADQPLLPTLHPQDTLDETLPDTLHMSTIYLMILLTSLAIVTVSIHYYAALTAALFSAFFVMQVGGAHVCCLSVDCACLC